jgi:prepilin-type N-terminal cleavage/methylation domain-containing protein
MPVVPTAVRRAFTLIELLIVVAIIAILAAIAVPNFLQAQVRAKTSRVRSDFRTVATAMEAYFVDFNSYVNDSDNTVANDGQGGLALLTSPIAYITTLASDPFQSQVTNNDAQGASKYYEMGSGSDNQGWRHSRFGTNHGPQGTGAGAPRLHTWLLFSAGPDFADDISGSGGNDCWPGGPGFANSVTITTYDPTNGVISGGDLIRVGGETGYGNYFINGQRLGPIPND